MDVNAAGDAVFSGQVEVKLPEGTLTAESASSMADGDVDVLGRINFVGPDVTVFGENGHYDEASETMSFSSAGFDLPKRPARGSAEHIEVASDSRMSLMNALFTTCPPENLAWELSARDIALDVNGGVGTARGVKLDFKGVPILYAPYFTFPINDARKSGFLTPDISKRDRTGWDLVVPYYLNLAPNYDLTLEPRYMSERGTQVRSDFRYLMPNSRGDFGFEYLPDDDETNTTRRYANLQHESLFGGMRSAGSAGRIRRSLRRCLFRGPRQHLERHEPDALEPLPRSHVLRAELVSADALAELSDHRSRVDGRRASVRARAANGVRRPLARTPLDVRLEHGAGELRSQRRHDRLAARFDAKR